MTGIRHRTRSGERRNMEVHAAMVDSMDQGIGRIIEQVKKQGQFDNTLFSIFQDNGGCAEGYGRYAPKKPYPEYKPMGPDQFQTKIWPPMQTDGRAVRHGPGVMAGPEDTFIGYGRGWAMSLTLLFASISTSLTRAVLLRLWWHTGPRDFKELPW